MRVSPQPVPVAEGAPTPASRGAVYLHPAEGPSTYGHPRGGGGGGGGGGAGGGGVSFAGRFRLRCLVVCASVAAPVRSPSVSLSRAGYRRSRCAGSGGGCDFALGCAVAAAATSVSVAAAISGPSSCTCGCARDWSVCCCVVFRCRFGRLCGRFRPTSGGGSGGRRWSGWLDEVAVVGDGASLGGLAVLPESSVLRRVTRGKDSATVSWRFDGSAVAAVAA